jgi:hypothetical protein
MRCFLLLTGFILLLTGCSYSDVVITGPVTDEIDHENVIVYYDIPPQCDIETVAYIRVPGDFLSRESLVSEFKNKASQLGATAVQVIDIQKSGASNYFGSARAIRCASD